MWSGVVTNATSDQDNAVDHGDGGMSDTEEGDDIEQVILEVGESDPPSSSSSLSSVGLSSLRETDGRTDTPRIILGGTRGQMTTTSLDHALGALRGGERGAGVGSLTMEGPRSSASVILRHSTAALGSARLQTLDDVARLTDVVRKKFVECLVGVYAAYAHSQVARALEVIFPQTASSLMPHARRSPVKDVRPLFTDTMSHLVTLANAIRAHPSSQPTYFAALQQKYKTYDDQRKAALPKLLEDMRALPATSIKSLLIASLVSVHEEEHKLHNEWFGLAKNAIDLVHQHDMKDSQAMVRSQQLQLSRFGPQRDGVIASYHKHVALAQGMLPSNASGGERGEAILVVWKEEMLPLLTQWIQQHAQFPQRILPLLSLWTTNHPLGESAGAGQPVTADATPSDPSTVSDRQFADLQRLLLDLVDHLSHGTFQCLALSARDRQASTDGDDDGNDSAMVEDHRASLVDLEDSTVARSTRDRLETLQSRLTQLKRKELRAETQVAEILQKSMAPGSATGDTTAKPGNDAASLTNMSSEHASDLLLGLQKDIADVETQIQQLRSTLREARVQRIQMVQADCEQQRMQWERRLSDLLVLVNEQTERQLEESEARIRLVYGVQEECLRVLTEMEAQSNDGMKEAAVHVLSSASQLSTTFDVLRSNLAQQTRIQGELLILAKNREEFMSRLALTDASWTTRMFNLNALEEGLYQMHQQGLLQFALNKLMLYVSHTTRTLEEWRAQFVDPLLMVVAA